MCAGANVKLVTLRNHFMGSLEQNKNLHLKIVEQQLQLIDRDLEIRKNMEEINTLKEKLKRGRKRRIHEEIEIIFTE